MALNLLDLNRAHKPRPRRLPSAGPKPKLAVTTVPVFRVYFKDLEAYIGNVFGFHDYDFLVASGIIEGTGIDYKVDGVIPNTSGFLKQIEEIRDGRRNKNVLLLLNLLCQDGYISAGTYCVDTTKRTEPSLDYRALLMRTRNPVHPDCVAFKERHKSDARVMGIVSKYDNAFLEQTQ